MHITIKYRAPDEYLFFCPPIFWRVVFFPKSFFKGVISNWRIPHSPTFFFLAFASEPKIFLSFSSGCCMIKLVCPVFFSTNFWNELKNRGSDPIVRSSELLHPLTCLSLTHCTCDCCTFEGRQFFCDKRPRYDRPLAPVSVFLTCPTRSPFSCSDLL